MACLILNIENVNEFEIWKPPIHSIKNKIVYFLGIA